ncbi:hypothetical protein B0T16DRAFT_87017 [Cercophora newfieldiana]|uniref:RING-type domain-containing protein n=1 Tax=Cercophora newfieldiana TaxID=92897 RepID=A0AA39YHS7_9PEZI|nr:hypothetical protein B0T16DRAFT_87017 [Cercophora newfieldiana]
MPASRIYPEPIGFRLLGLLGLPFTLARGFCTLIGSAAMNVMMRRKTRRSLYIKDTKQPLFSEKPVSSITNAQEVETTCSICQEPVGTRKPEGFAEAWSYLPCGHQFGSHCIKQYLRIVADDRPSCPICRQAAYHGCCGHPVLPTVLNSTASHTRIGSKGATERLQELQKSTCSYCQGSGRTRMIKARRPKTRLRAWLVSIAAAPRRLIGRNRRNVTDGVPSYVRGSLLVPWRDDEDAGPWLDPFPRARDPEWERWWDVQEPATSV